MKRVCLGVLALFAPLALLASAPLTGPPFRFSRPIEARPGWARLELPDDVLDACRPGLPDLRVQEKSGKDIAYVLEERRRETSSRFPIENLESVEKVETVGMIDRGVHPPLAASVTFEIAAEDFLKPVRIESSDDRSAWRDIARGSVFATAGVRMVTLHFPRNDRRYLRFRFDDRNSAALKPVALVAEAPADSTATRQLLLDVSPSRSEETESSLYSVALPAANLPLTALTFEAEEPAFARPVRVFERVAFRDEVSRRLVAESTINKSPEGEASTELPMSSVAGRNLEIEIDDGDAPPLTHLKVTALLHRRGLLFFAPAGSELLLLYGSGAARAPDYDLDRALTRGIPKSVREATLGPPKDRGNIGAAASLVSSPGQGAPLDPTKWTMRREILLPRSGIVAYLDFERLGAGGLSDLRIVDRQNRQVPFIVEQCPRERRRKVHPAISPSGTRTMASIEGLNFLSSAEAIELSASGPHYFSREVRVVEDERDQRGITAVRELGATRWEQRPDEKARRLRIPITRPQNRSLRVEIENGDNAAVTIGEMWVLTSVARIDFAFRPEDKLVLLTGNPEAPPPRYDLAMLANAVLASPAQAARLGSAGEIGTAAWKTPSWFWAVVVLAVLLLALGLSRTLKTSS